MPTGTYIVQRYFKIYILECYITIRHYDAQRGCLPWVRHNEKGGALNEHEDKVLTAHVLKDNPRPFNYISLPVKLVLNESLQ